MINQGLGRHCHHDRLFEWVTNFDERVEYIKKNKPENEQPLRLKLLALVPEDRIPGRDSPEWVAYYKAGEACNKAGEAYEKAWVASEKAGEAYEKAGVAYYKAWVASEKAWVAYYSKYQNELVALHKELCPDCPWDGVTIFTRQDEQGVWY